MSANANLCEWTFSIENDIDHGMDWNSCKHVAQASVKQEQQEWEQ